MRLEPLKTTYKDVSNRKIDFVGKTKTTAKPNKETIELPLLITKAQTTPLLGLDWMQRLEINLSANHDAIKVHNIKLDDTERSIIKLLNDFKDLLYNNKEITNLSVKVKLKPGAQIIQQKGRPIPIHLHNQVEQELKRLTKHGEHLATKLDFDYAYGKIKLVENTKTCVYLPLQEATSQSTTIS